ncbi:fibrinogen C domain-containing protein 1-like [Asterias rubens]|uniref:fibrinogen C domain-containing protein 1-like n=1 Tax=Asterias rubens TaxID=7604 RepID=UPI0014551B19|nr:fibrinogen C domain-containing protein 1-like [Asterias rubens]
MSQSYADCNQIRNASGVYTLNLTSIPGLQQAYCDMETAESGFIVIQRRRDGSVDFNRSWSEYQEGFGDLEGEFWWGNEKLRTLTDTEVSTWELVVDLEAFDGDVGRVRYGNFSVTGELYDLTVEDFDSLNDEGDGLVQQQLAFTTIDEDNDKSRPKNCARERKGGWWYTKCKKIGSNLNGKYFNETQSHGPDEGVLWKPWKSNSLRGCQMKIRRNK